jgi:hypothetical protein
MCQEKIMSKNNSTNSSNVCTCNFPGGNYVVAGKCFWCGQPEAIGIVTTRYNSRPIGSTTIEWEPTKDLNNLATDYAPVMSNNKKVSGNATKNSSNKGISNEALLVLAGFLVPLCMGICIAALIYNQSYGRMDAVEGLSAARYWLKGGAIIGGVLGTIAIAFNYATKGVK